MGVLACDRNGCDNIMCDRLSHTFGYLCYSCFDELISKRDIVTTEDIKQFMESEKDYTDYTKARTEYFNTIFPPLSYLNDD